SGDPKPLAGRHPLLADVNAIDWTGFGALIAGDARRQIVTMKTAIARRDGNGQLGILEMLGERPSIGIVGLEPVPQRHPHAVGDRGNRIPNIAKPATHLPASEAA